MDSRDTNYVENYELCLTFVNGFPLETLLFKLELRLLLWLCKMLQLTKLGFLVWIFVEPCLKIAAIVRLVSIFRLEWVS